MFILDVAVTSSANDRNKSCFLVSSLVSLIFALRKGKNYGNERHTFARCDINSMNFHGEISVRCYLFLAPGKTTFRVKQA